MKNHFKIISIMKKSIIFAISTLLLISCKTPQLVSCEDVTRTNDLPWLTSIVQQGVTALGQKLVSIDKIVYSTENSNTTNIGFEVVYETRCCDIPSEFIYDCDGEVITYYGGINGCNGECDITIRSRTRIYTASGL